MAVVGLDIVANICFVRAAVLALASIEAEHSALQITKSYKFLLPNGNWKNQAEYLLRTCTVLDLWLRRLSVVWLRVSA